MTACAVCQTPLEPRDGPGRPSIYCSEGCRRLAEYRLRGLTKRIDSTELELREVLGRLGRGQYLDADERRRRVRQLKKWIAEDTRKLRELLGVKAA